MNNEHNPPRHSTDSRDCDALRDLLPAYSMGLTDSDETALIEQRLSACPELQAELATYRTLAATLPAAVAQVTPPGSLRASLLKRAAAAEPAHPIPAPIPPPIPAPRTRTRRVQAWFAGMAAILVTVLLGVIAVQQAELVHLREENAQLADRITIRDSLLALASEDGFTRYTLPATASNTGAQATVFSRDDARDALIRVSGFTPNAPGRVYQAWLIQGDERLSAGTFTVGSDGSATLAFSSPLRLAEIEFIGITPEPAGGSPGPTGDPVVFGPVGGA